MRAKNRAVAVLAAFVLVLALLFPAFFVISEANHDCTGIACRICEQICVCMHFLDGAVRSSCRPAAVHSLVAAALCVCAISVFKKPNTLIKLKVKLSD